MEDITRKVLEDYLLDKHYDIVQRFKEKRQAASDAIAEYKKAKGQLELHKKETLMRELLDSKEKEQK